MSALSASAVRWLVRRHGALHERLLLYVVVAAVAGIVASPWATALNGTVPILLGGQVAGVALTLTARRLVGALRRPVPLLAALVVHWGVLAPLGIGLGHLIGTNPVGTGVLICAVCPAEITSSLVGVLAGGSGATAVSLMAATLLTGTVLTPLWVRTGLNGASVDARALLVELALCVAMPLVVGVTVRTRVPAMAGQAARCLDLAAVSVVLVVFVAAGSARDVVLSRALPGAVAACLLLQAACYAAGTAVGVVLRLPTATRRAVLFPLGMREFGVATAVALTVAPSAAGVAGIYGILVMVTGPALAQRLRRRRRTPPVVS